MSQPIAKAVLARGPQNPEHRFALLVLAMQARPDGTSRTSTNFLVRQTATDWMTVTRLLTELRHDGWFWREGQPTGAPIYHLALERLGVPVSPEPELHVRRAISPALNTAACVTCGAALPTATQGVQ